MNSCTCFDSDRLLSRLPPRVCVQVAVIAAQKRRLMPLHVQSDGTAPATSEVHLCGKLAAQPGSPIVRVTST